MTHIGLFEGIGGFSLAAKWMGWQTVAWCEINPFGQEVLKYYHPKAEGFSDIITSNFSKYANKIDVLTGGFPCQPYSLAGKRKGNEDERHLWPQMLRSVKEIQPGWVVGENVFGLINWSGGLVFHEVQTDLEAAGYEVWPYVLPACAVNAPHRRDRVWFVAKRKDGYGCTDNNAGFGATADTGIFGCNDRGDNREKRCIQTDKRTTPEDQSAGNERQCGAGKAGETNTDTHSDGQHRSNSEHEKHTSEGGQYALHDTKPVRNAADTERLRQQGSGRAKHTGDTKEDAEWKASWSYDDGRWPTQSAICSRNDGLSPKLSGTTISKHRIESIKAYGNAIVPQVALQIFKSIQDYENLVQQNPT